jgi:hypothetical protein
MCTALLAVLLGLARLSGDGGAVDCASETFAAATVANAAMIGTAKRKGNSFRLCGVCLTTCRAP